LKIQFPSFALPIIALPKFLASYCKKSLRFPSKVSNALVFFPNDRTFNLDLLIPKKKKITIIDSPNGGCSIGKIKITDSTKPGQGLHGHMR
jgi:hypothetical protein